MGFSKTIYSLIGVLVAVIMIATVAMPAITSASTTTTTTTATEIQDVEVSDPIYYKPYFGKVRVVCDNQNSLSVQQYYGSGWTGYTLEGDFTSIPILVSDTVVSILHKDENNYYISTTGISLDNGGLNSDQFVLSAPYTYTFEFTSNKVDVMAELHGNVDNGSSYPLPTWNYIVSIPEYGKGDYVTSTSQDTVTLGSLNEVVAGSAYSNGYQGTFAYIRNGEQTQYGDQALELDSVQTDAGLDVSLKASYGETEVLVLVPTTTEITVTQTITVQTEYGPLLNVVLLILLIVPVTAVAAMLYSRRD